MLDLRNILHFDINHDCSFAFVDIIFEILKNYTRILDNNKMQSRFGKQGPVDAGKIYLS